MPGFMKRAAKSMQMGYRICKSKAKRTCRRLNPINWLLQVPKTSTVAIPNKISIPPRVTLARIPIITQTTCNAVVKHDAAAKTTPCAEHVLETQPDTDVQLSAHTTADSITQSKGTAIDQPIDSLGEHPSKHFSLPESTHNFQSRSMSSAQNSGTSGLPDTDRSSPRLKDHESATSIGTDGAPASSTKRPGTVVDVNQCDVNNAESPSVLIEAKESGATVATDNKNTIQEQEHGAMDHDSLLTADDEETDEEEDDNDDDDLCKEFQTVIEALNVDKLEEVALRVRQELDENKGESVKIEYCAVLESQPLCGTFNICYLLNFDNDSSWVARIPGWGKSPTQHQIEKMNSELHTMRYIRSKTDFKMPEAYYWNTSPDEIGVAFSLISYIPGFSLGTLWNGFNQEMKLQALTDIATEMAKLYMLQFDRTGILRFTSDGQHSHIGPEIRFIGVEQEAWAKSYQVAPFHDASKWLNHDLDKISQSIFSRILSLIRQKHDSLDQMDENLKTMFKSIPDYLHQAPLSLSLADADFQNVLCDPETGRVNAFIDLDNVRITPVVVGAAAYPPILTRDRDPMSWHRDKACGIKYNESEFPALREHYARAFSAALPLYAHYDSRWTRMSVNLTTMQTALTFCSHRELVMLELERYAYGNCFADKRYHQWEILRSEDAEGKNRIGRRRYKNIIRDGLWVDEASPDTYANKLAATLAGWRARNMDALTRPTATNTNADAVAVPNGSSVPADSVPVA